MSSRNGNRKKYYAIFTTTARQFFEGSIDVSPEGFRGGIIRNARKFNETLIVLLFASIELSNLLMPPREPGKVRGETTENKIIKEVKGDKNN